MMMRFDIDQGSVSQWVDQSAHCCCSQIFFRLRGLPIQFCLGPCKYYTFGCIFKKRGHVFLSEHQCMVSMSNNVNIMKYQLRNGGSFAERMEHAIRGIILLRGLMRVAGCLFLLCENFSLH